MFAVEVTDRAKELGAQEYMLDEHVSGAFANLNPKQQAYLLNLLLGGMFPIDAAIAAGYTDKMESRTLNKLANNSCVQRAKTELLKKIWFKNGIPKEAKREVLWNTITSETAKKSEITNAMKALMELDGDIERGGNNTGTTINLQLDRVLGGEGVSVSIEQKKAPIEGHLNNDS